MKHLLIPIAALVGLIIGYQVANHTASNAECALQEARLDLGDSIGVILSETRNSKPFKEPKVELRTEPVVTLEWQAPWTQIVGEVVEL